MDNNFSFIWYGERVHGGGGGGGGGDRIINVSIIIIIIVGLSRNRITGLDTVFIYLFSLKVR